MPAAPNVNHRPRADGVVVDTRQHPRLSLRPHPTRRPHRQHRTRPPIAQRRQLDPDLVIAAVPRIKARRLATIDHPATSLGRWCAIATNYDLSLLAAPSPFFRPRPHPTVLVTNKEKSGETLGLIFSSKIQGRDTPPKEFHVSDVA